MIGTETAVGIGLFLLMFGTVLGLLRIEYDMPAGLSVAFSCSAVLFGFVLAVGGRAAGVATTVEIAGGLAVLTVGAAVAVAAVG